MSMEILFNREDLVVGKLQLNRTMKYLVPALNFYGSTFKLKFNMIHKVKFGIFDNLLEGTPYEGQKNIYVLIDTQVKNNSFLDFMVWIKNQDYFILNYQIDARYTMLVIKFPEELEDSFDKFLKGKYSKMYCKDEIEKYFSSEKHKESREVLERNFNAKNNFKKILKENFNVILQEEDFKSIIFEYDIPPIKNEEVFNF